jgi:hypothetical protein
MNPHPIRRLTPVSPVDRRWELAHPVSGSPSLIGLAGALRIGGWEPLELALSEDGEFITFSLQRSGIGSGVADGREAALRSVIRGFRLAGFSVGFSEVAIDAYARNYVTGGSLVGPLEQLCKQGPVPVGP